MKLALTTDYSMWIILLFGLIILTWALTIVSWVKPGICQSVLRPEQQQRRNIAALRGIKPAAIFWILAADPFGGPEPSC